MTWQVLVATGSEPLRRRVRALLEAARCTVCEATTAEDARLALVARTLSLAVVDEELPDGLGTDVLAFAARICPSVHQLLVAAPVPGRTAPEKATRLARDFADEELSGVLAALRSDAAGAGPPRDPASSLAAQLVVLKELYVASLPDRLRALRAAMAAAPSDRTALGAARTIAHKIHGTAGTHGLRALGEDARALDRALAALSEDASDAAWASAAALVERLAAAIAAASLPAM